MSIHRKPWTPEDDEKLRALVASGKKVSEIVLAMRRTESAVDSRMRALKLKLPREKGTPKAQRLEEVKRLHAEGKTVAEMVEILKTQSPAIYLDHRALGLIPHRPKSSRPRRTWW